MYMINTTHGWNLGDDLIREGVFNLLDINDKSMVFINRNQIKINETLWKPQWQMEQAFTNLDDILRCGKAYVVAGTPEWLNQTEKIYRYCIDNSIPIYIIGVGMNQTDLGLLKLCSHLIKIATTRDRFAKEFLESAGISTERFPDPAFYANYPTVNKKSHKLVINYRAYGGNGKFDTRNDNYWQSILQKFSEHIDLVTVHEPGEYSMAHKIFGKLNIPIFFSSDYTKYKEIYANTSVYIGGRIHGAVPVVASGGTAWLTYRAQKVEALRPIEHACETLKILDYNTYPEHSEALPNDLTLKYLETQKQKYFDYIRDKRLKI